MFANEGDPKSKSSRKETSLKIKKYKEIHVSGKNLEKKFSAPTPNIEYRTKANSYDNGAVTQNQMLWKPLYHAGVCFSILRSGKQR